MNLVSINREEQDIPPVKDVTLTFTERELALIDAGLTLYDRQRYDNGAGYSSEVIDLRILLQRIHKQASGDQLAQSYLTKYDDTRSV